MFPQLLATNLQVELLTICGELVNHWIHIIGVAIEEEGTEAVEGAEAHAEAYTEAEEAFSQEHL